MTFSCVSRTDLLLLYWHISNCKRKFKKYLYVMAWIEDIKKGNFLLSFKDKHYFIDIL